MELAREDDPTFTASSRPYREVAKGYVPFRDGDLLIAKITPCFQNGKGGIAQGLSDGIGFGSTEFHVLRPGPEVSVKYLYYATGNKAFRDIGVMQMRGSAGQQRVPQDYLADFVLPVPPRTEQKVIVAFLDRKLEEIDRYLIAKRRQIDLLEEQEGQVVFAVVSRGLEAGETGTASGLDWMPIVNARWRRTPLKYVAAVQTGITLGKKYGPVPLIRRPYMRVANVQDGHLALGDVTAIEVPASEAAGSELQPGDVLMTEGGDIDKLGRGQIWNGEIPGCLHQNHIFAVRTNHTRLLPEYLVLLMRSRHGRSYFMYTAKKTTNLASTNSTTLKRFPLFLPPVEEQRRMIDRIAEQTGALRRTIEIAEQEIELMTEYRTTLIAEAVCGRLDVRRAS